MNVKTSSRVLPSREEILGEIRPIVAEFASMGTDDIREGHRFFVDLAFDSLDVVEMQMELEEHFDISIPDDSADQIKTVGDMADMVLGLIGSRDG